MAVRLRADSKMGFNNSARSPRVRSACTESGWASAWMALRAKVAFFRVSCLARNLNGHGFAPEPASSQFSNHNENGHSYWHIDRNRSENPASSYGLKLSADNLFDEELGERNSSVLTGSYIQLTVGLIGRPASKGHLFPGIFHRGLFEPRRFDYRGL
jgi:hypothetical protein